MRFRDVESLLNDSMEVTVEDDRTHGQQRFVTVGVDAIRRTVVVRYTNCTDEIRLLSARRVTRRSKGTMKKEYDSARKDEDRESKIRENSYRHPTSTETFCRRSAVAPRGNPGR